MTDAHRSWNMSRIKGRDTKPELLVRKILTTLRFKFETNDSSLAGSPDIVLRRRRVAIFVHGCFWHRHRNCKFAYNPKTNTAFWEKKFHGNVIRDRRKLRQLRHAGWSVFVIWECECRDVEKLKRRLLKAIRKTETAK